MSVGAKPSGVVHRLVLLALAKRALASCAAHLSQAVPPSPSGIQVHQAAVVHVVALCRIVLSLSKPGHEVAERTPLPSIAAD